MAEWKELTTVTEWEKVWEQSAEQPVLVLKHSTQCPISANAFKESEAYLQNNPRDDVNYVLVKVIESRDVSNKIAADTGVKHESPQLLFVQNKQATWNASHWDITKKAVSEALS